jgi:hypothetical protein
MVDCASLLVVRVTRLGEFSLIGQLFTLGRVFLKIAEVAQILGYFFPRKKRFIYKVKTDFGNILGHFLQTRLITVLVVQVMIRLFTNDRDKSLFNVFTLEV